MLYHLAARAEGHVDACPDLKSNPDLSTMQFLEERLGSDTASSMDSALTGASLFSDKRVPPKFRPPDIADFHD